MIHTSEMEAFISRVTRGKWESDPDGIRTCSTSYCGLPLASVRETPSAAGGAPEYTFSVYEYPDGPDGKPRVIRRTAFTPVMEGANVIGYCPTDDFVDHFRKTFHSADFYALKARVARSGSSIPLSPEEWMFVRGCDPEWYADLAFYTEPFNTDDGMLVLACLAPEQECVPDDVWDELSRRYNLPLTDDRNAFLSACVEKMNRGARVVWKNGEKTRLTYEDVCHDLGFIPETKFVEITNAGTITFTCGSPYEVKGLLRAVREKGYKPAQSLLRNAR